MTGFSQQELRSRPLESAKVVWRGELGIGQICSPDDAHFGSTLDLTWEVFLELDGWSGWRYVIL